MKNRILLSSFALVLNLQLGECEGLLGQKYWGLSYENATVADVDLWGVSAHYNRKLFTDSTYSYDLNVQISHAELDVPNIDAKADGIEAGLVVYSDRSSEVKPFLGLSAGYGEGSVFGFNEDSFKYQISIGGELKASERFIVTPYAKYFDYTSIDEGDDFEVGVEASFWATQNVNIGLDYSNISALGESLNIYSLFFRKKF